LGNWRRLVQFGLILVEVGEDLVDGGALSSDKVAKFFQFQGARVDLIDAIVQIVKERKIIFQCRTELIHLENQDAICFVE
jgi:hypothetical protein